MFILFIFFLIYCYLETHMVVMVRRAIVIENLPPELEGLRILHLSDLHARRFTKYHRHIGEILENIDSDVAVFTGDYKLNYRVPNQRPARTLAYIISRIKSRLGVYGVLGNKEGPDFIPFAEHCGFTVLKDQKLRLEINGAGLWLIGMDKVHPLKQEPALDQILEGIDQADFTILLAHSPDYLPWLKGRKIDLFLVGDTHGGQMVLPFIGPLKVKSKISRRYVRGILRQNGTIMYINSGLGWSGIPARFMCRPEAAVIILRRRI